MELKPKSLMLGAMLAIGSFAAYGIGSPSGVHLGHAQTAGTRSNSGVALPGSLPLPAPPAVPSRRV
jgi:hypothetical protein